MATVAAVATVTGMKFEWNYWLEICYPTLFNSRPSSYDRLRPSKMVVDARGKASYRWLLTEVERKHIADLLDIDVTTITFRGSTMNRERQICKFCGKASGLDDIVQNSLDLGTHTRELILNAFKLGLQDPSSLHDIYCSDCGEKHDHQTGWAVYNEKWLF
ncbi:hypothetical protein BDZ45DRAFT_770028 [Acephala macrosclerotiorum]|nr:hypothetical protein BDZ45DRAFT_770028 [Acephala macrosclerotiorum]